MSPEIKQLCEEESLKKFENAIREESEYLVSLTKRHFWNSLVLAGFFFWMVGYTIFSSDPQKIIIGTLFGMVMLASLERFFLQKSIKLKVSKLATFSAIIEFLKNVKKNECTSNR